MLADLSPIAESAYREALARARRLGRPVLASWTCPLAAHDALGFFGQPDGSHERALWSRPGSGETFVGVGAASTLTAHGETRFDNIGAAWRDLLVDSVIDGQGDALAHAGPRLLGGFSFDPSRRPSALWTSFPDGRMTLPERQLTVRSGTAWLTTNVLVEPDSAAAANAKIRRQPVALGGREAEAPLSPARWQHLVGAVARAIGHHQLGIDKVVLARAQQVELSSPFDARATLRTLVDRYRACTVFAIGQSDACFLGATPERLITLRHGLATTMALAGSIARGATPAEDEALGQRLLRDPKERTEHAVVVTALRDDLSHAGLCNRVMADAEPRVHKLANVQHLLTQLTAQVAPGTSVLDLVARMHPTPAVGGFPRDRALQLIRDHEQLDRGWYAGPIGWLDARGDGEFVVGIRSALVRGSTATLFAGCGIVADSTPAAEYLESSWKLQPMLTALGVVE